MLGRSEIISATETRQEFLLRIIKMTGNVMTRDNILRAETIHFPRSFSDPKKGLGGHQEPRTHKSPSKEATTKKIANDIHLGQIS
jgi:hypothetical protein